MRELRLKVLPALNHNENIIPRELKVDARFLQVGGGAPKTLWLQMDGKESEGHH